ncbi:MAG: hypothetical protein RIQ71_1565 [Verrucomicrobiota bacterium]|jgi:hypothetical protein
MTRRRIILLLAVVLLVLGLWRLLRAPGPVGAPQTAPAAVIQSPEEAITQQGTLANDEIKKQVLDQVAQVFSAPIAFYGKVIDQNGEPVPHASIGYTAADKFNASGSNYTGQTDENGLFDISGIEGAGLSVGVGKEGYYPVEGKSSQIFGYGIGSDSVRKPPPTKDAPAIFVLHKMGKTESLTFLSGRQFDVPASGRPVTIDLVTGRPNGRGLRVESWLGDTGRRPFDWRYQLSIPEGGLVERTGQFDFVAPEVGYQPTVEIKMPAAGEDWSSRLEKTYFAKLPDGKYARFKIRFYPGPQRNFVVLESYVNPQPGSRNLEYNPKQASGIQ